MKNYKKDASVFKAFCDENRLQILDMLKEGEICACKILEKLNIVQSTHENTFRCQNSKRQKRWKMDSL